MHFLGNLFFFCLHFRSHGYLCVFPLPGFSTVVLPTCSEPSLLRLHPQEEAQQLWVCTGVGWGMGGLFLSLSFSIFLCLTSKAQGKHWYRRKPCPQVRWSLPCSDEQISRSSVSLVCSYGPPTAAGLCLSGAELL